MEEKSKVGPYLANKGLTHLPVKVHDTDHRTEIEAGDVRAYIPERRGSTSSNED